jgi:hypothetical protein
MGGAGVNSIPQKRGALYSGPATARPTASRSRASRRTLSRPAHDRQWLPEVFPLASPPLRLTTGSRLTAKRTSGRGRVSAGHMHQHLGRGRRAGLLAAKAELRYWAMPLGGFAKGDSPAAIAQAAQRPSGLPNTERPKLSRGSLSHLREPERRPDALAFGKI